MKANPADEALLSIMTFSPVSAHRQFYREHLKLKSLLPLGENTVTAFSDKDGN